MTLHAEPEAHMRARRHTPLKHITISWLELLDSVHTILTPIFKKETICLPGLI